MRRCSELPKLDLAQWTYSTSVVAEYDKEHANNYYRGIEPPHYNYQPPPGYGESGPLIKVPHQGEEDANASTPARTPKLTEPATTTEETGEGIP